ncbi:Zinc finger, TAZ-type [Phytophthora cactorum]|nr:Zinc finger, TAZ-type [Phytophthora cactorum]
MVTTTPTSNGTTNGSSNSSGSTPQFINLRDYLSESSSEQQQQQAQQPEPQQLEPHVEQEEQEEQEQSMDQERMRAAAASEADSENEAANATEVATMDPIQPAPTSDNTPTTSATTENRTGAGRRPGKKQLLLIHACNCDDVKCTDPEFHVFCPHMKRFLRSVCWASHSDKWRAYRLARITAELFAYHAMNCTVPQCNVPLCVKIREEEIV